jgi:hypothetical protein
MQRAYYFVLFLRLLPLTAAFSKVPLVIHKEATKPHQWVQVRGLYDIVLAERD